MSSDNPYLARSARKRHGQLAERKAARRLKGRHVPGSGAKEGRKGDIHKGQFLIESKATTRASISVQRTWLEKINKEALDAGRVPALLVQFVDAQGRLQPGGGWVLIRESTFMELCA